MNKYSTCFIPTYNIFLKRFLSLTDKYLLSSFQFTKVMENNISKTEEKDDCSGCDSSSSSTDQAEGKSDLNMEKIRKFLEQKLHIFDSEPKESTNKILNDTSLDGIADYIQKNNIKKIITLAGAGISTSAGIPDFRSPKSGLYHNLDKYNLPHPQAIFELDFFRENPEPFFVLAKELMPEGYKPTPSHYFIRLLHDKGLLLRHYTQNIDTLERVAGIPENKLMEAHGTFYTGHCLDCRASYDLEWLKDKIKEVTVPKCDECKQGVVKPDIVFFGEMLPDRFHRLIMEDFPDAELLIIMGSSLVVQPFASLVDRVNSDCPRLLINKEKVGMQDRLTKFLGLGGGLDFDSDNGRDVAWLGECDKGCQLLAEKLGWAEELKELISKEYKRLDNETETSSVTREEKQRHNKEQASNK